MNRGGLGARSLNIELQNALNPPGEIRIERFGWTFCPGDKVMQVENDYDKDAYNYVAPSRPPARQIHESRSQARQSAGPLRISSRASPRRSRGRLGQYRRRAL